MKKEIIIGVGKEKGLRAQLAMRFATMGVHVFIASRTESRLESLCKKIENKGGNVTAVCADAINEEHIKNLFKRAGDDLKLAIYNTGNNFPGSNN